MPSFPRPAMWKDFFSQKSWSLGKSKTNYQSFITRLQVGLVRSAPSDGCWNHLLAYGAKIQHLVAILFGGLLQVAWASPFSSKQYLTSLPLRLFSDYTQNSIKRPKSPWLHSSAILILVVTHIILIPTKSFSYVLQEYLPKHLLLHLLTC